MADAFVNDLETVGKDIVHAVEYPIEFCVKATAVIESVVKDDPTAKTILTTIVTKAEAIGADGTKDILEKGLNPVDDLATLAAIKDLSTYIETTVIPFIEKVYGEVITDLKAS